MLLSLIMMGPGETMSLIGVVLGVSFLGSRLLTPVMQGWGRRLGGPEGGADPALRVEVEELRARVQELEGQQARMYELEERLDFTERLLARQRDDEAARLPRGG